MASIIVPTDFSDNAYNALYYATRLFPDEPCKITLIHSFESQFSTSTSRIDIGKNEKLYDDFKSRADVALEEVKHKIIRDSKGLDLKVVCYTSATPLFKMVNQLIIKAEIDFVVMGTKGASGLKEVFIGSQAVSLIKKIKAIPLLLIPKNTDFLKPTTIAYATDLKIDYAQYPLEIIKEVVRAHKSQLHIAHIYNQKSPGNTVENNYKKLKHKLADIECNMHWISSEDSMEKALVNFMTKHQINLLVLMYHKYGFLKRILKKSFVEKVGFHSKVPLLILPDSF